MFGHQVPEADRDAARPCTSSAAMYGCAALAAAPRRAAPGRRTACRRSPARAPPPSGSARTRPRRAREQDAGEREQDVEHARTMAASNQPPRQAAAIASRVPMTIARQRPRRPAPSIDVRAPHEQPREQVAALAVEAEQVAADRADVGVARGSTTFGSYGASTGPKTAIRQREHDDASASRGRPQPVPRRPGIRAAAVACGRRRRWPAIDGAHWARLPSVTRGSSSA